MAAAIEMGLRALGTQALTFLALVLDAVMFGYVIYDPNTLRVVASVLFSVLSWCLVKLAPIGRR